jgi:hypothetical protein
MRYRQEAAIMERWVGAKLTRLRMGGAWLVLLLWGMASLAHASAVVIVPPRAEDGVSSEAVEQAVSELMRLIRAQGLDPISPGQSAASAEEARDSGGFPRSINPHECLSPECATEFRKLFDASFAVQLSLFAEARRPSSVAVVITETPKAYFAGTKEIEGGDIQAAVRASYLAARDKHLQGAGPWLSVQGTPAGATVYVDGVEYGKLPIDRRHLEPGRHRVQVRQDGFISQDHAVEVPADIDHDERIELALIATQDGRSERRVDRTWDYLLGGALAAAGAVHLGFGFYQLSKDGDCAERRGGQCVEAYGDRTGIKQERLLLGLGAVGVAAGGLVMGLAPIGHLRVRFGRETAFIALTRGF